MGKKDREMSRLKKEIDKLHKELNECIGDEEVYQGEIERLQGDNSRLKSDFYRQEAKSKKSELKVSAYQWDIKKKNRQIEKLKGAVKSLAEERRILRVQLNEYEDEAQELDAKADNLAENLEKASNRLRKGGNLIDVGDLVYGTVEPFDIKCFKLCLDSGDPIQIKRRHETSPGEKIAYRVTDKKGAIYNGFIIDSENRITDSSAALGKGTVVEIHIGRQLYKPGSKGWDNTYLYAGFPDGAVRFYKRHGDSLPMKFKIMDFRIDSTFLRVFDVKPYRR